MVACACACACDLVIVSNSSVGQVAVSSIFSQQKGFDESLINVFIRDITDIDTSKDRKPSWAIPPINSSFRVIVGCCDALWFILRERETSLSSRSLVHLKDYGCYFFYPFPLRLKINWVPVQWFTLANIPRRLMRMICICFLDDVDYVARRPNLGAQTWQHDYSYRHRNLFDTFSL